jgi:hypothetical protein
MDKNKELHELLGLCWDNTYRCEEDNDNPDYKSDFGKTQLLRLMWERVGTSTFWLKTGDMMLENEVILIDLDLILDETGKLRDLAIEWLTAQKEV